MNLLIGCGDYSTISGAPMFVYTLAVEMRRRGHQVVVVAPNVNGVMATKTREHDIEVTTYDKVRGHFDVMHANGIQASHWAAHNHRGALVVATIHSTLVYETPLLHENISTYVGVRPEIVQKMIEVHGI